MFRGGSEHVHRIERINAGKRWCLALWFTESSQLSDEVLQCSSGELSRDALEGQRCVPSGRKNQPQSRAAQSNWSYRGYSHRGGGDSYMKIGDTQNSNDGQDGHDDGQDGHDDEF